MRSTNFDWAAHIGAVARRLCGEPNAHLSHAPELRFGTHGSLSVRCDKGTWYDHENGVGGGTLDLIRHKLGVSNGAAVDWLKSELKIEMPERVPSRQRPKWRLVETYDYFDEDGVCLSQAQRWDVDGKKTFTQAKSNGRGGWITGKGCMDGVRRVPYRLPELLNAAPDQVVFIAEGERKVNALIGLGFVATCNAEGSGNWHSEFAQYFQGKTVVVLPDNDEPGRAHAHDVARKLLSVAREVRIVALPDLENKGDIIDWLMAGGTREALLALTEAATPVRDMPAAGPHNIVPFRQNRMADDNATQENVPDLFGEPLNDIGNAHRLIAQHGAALRYIVGIGWHVWDGRRYEYDPATVHARKLAHATARDMLTYAFDLSDRTKELADAKKTLIKFAVSSGNTNKLNGMLAQAEPTLAAIADDLDRNPWLLNCANGAIDLRTAALLPHRQEDLITKLAPVAFNPDAGCPTWERAILEIFGGDTDMVDYVQRALGYCLTGLTKEQVVFILHGGGSNGKSVLLETVAAILGDYSAQCPSDTFVENNKGGAIPNDIARLVGARFVSVVETEQDRKLSEGLVKQATGGDRMTARFLRQEFFEFSPKFKLAMATNHKPRVRGTDNAIWRRIRLLPFLVTFADPEEAEVGQPIRDRDLKDKLLKEQEGILLWMIEGCLRWQKEGLTKAPKAVMEATTEYRESQDATQGFVEECCHRSPGLHVKVGAIYKAYRKWCEGAGETPLSSNAFGMALEEKGFPAKKGTGGVRERIGLNLKLEFDPESESMRHEVC